MAAIDALPGSLQQGIDDRLAWRTNAPVLYDILISCTLEWPALTVAWLPDTPGKNARLAIGTHTDGSAQHEVIVVELSCKADERIQASPWVRWNIEGMGDAEGFGCTPLPVGAPGPLRPVVRLRHPTEVNRVAPCLHKPSLLATKAATGNVYLFDYEAERQTGEVRSQTSLSAPSEPVDGFALCWSPLQKHLLASGGNDGKLCVWDVTAPRDVAPLRHHLAHEGGLCDLAFSRLEPSLLASVGDDREFRLWDERSALKPQVAQRVSDDEVYTVDWSWHDAHAVATAGKDGEVRVWDMRYFKTPTRSLRSHKGSVVAVRWAPCRATRLASCSSDSRLILWDLDPQEDAEDLEGPEEDPAELIFAHGGHTQGVSDFAWSCVDDYLLCTVGEDNGLQIWQPNALFYLGDDQEESTPLPAIETPAKRARIADNVE